MIVAALIIFIPGAVLARSLGARGITWLGMSAPLSMTLISVGAVAAQLVHVRWSLGFLIGFAAALSVVAAALRWILVTRRSSDRQPLVTIASPARIAALIGSLVLAAGIIGTRFTHIFISPGNISQTYDNVFHLNAVRFILNTGDGSSLYLGTLNPHGGKSFYPGAWHDLVALVVGATHVPIPVGVNAVNIVLGGLVWTISGIYLATRVLGTRPAVFLVAGAMAGAFSAFPYLLVDFGVLYPNFLAITLLPALIGLAADIFGLSAVPHPGTALGLVLMAVAAPGLALSHPSVFMALGAFVLAPLLYWLYRQICARVRGTLSWPLLIASVLTVAVYAEVLNIFWLTIRPSEKASFWPPTQTVAQAIGEALTNAPQGRPVSWAVMVLTAIGIYALVRSRKYVWLLGAFGVSVLLFVAVSGFEKGDVRSYFTGVFYNDSYRLAAMLPTVGLPLAVFGAVWLFDIITARAKAGFQGNKGALATIAAVGTAASLGVAWAAQDVSVNYATDRASENYVLSPESALLTSDENTLLERLDSHVPAGATIIGNPATGASLAYALANRTVILPAVGTTATPLDATLLNQLPNIATDPAVCAAVDKLDAFYVLDFGGQQINDLQLPFPTSAELAATPGLVVVDQAGPAILYKITSCK